MFALAKFHSSGGKSGVFPSTTVYQGHSWVVLWCRDCPFGGCADILTHMSRVTCFLSPQLGIRKLQDIIGVTWGRTDSTRVRGDMGALDSGLWRLLMPSGPACTSSKVHDFHLTVNCDEPCDFADLTAFMAVWPHSHILFHGQVFCTFVPSRIK